MALGDGQALHGGELVTPRGVGDLEGAHALIAADHLAVSVLHRRDVGVPEGAFYEAQDQGALPNSTCPEHHHTVVVALLRHSAPFRLQTVLHLHCKHTDSRNSQDLKMIQCYFSSFQERQVCTVY